MDGLPLFSMWAQCMPAARLTKAVGLLNSTTNICLTAMEGTPGLSLDEAVKIAQQAGIAEADPSDDLDGWDAAVKIAALATVLMSPDAPVRPEHVAREGIREVTSEMVADAKAQGLRYKLVSAAVAPATHPTPGYIAVGDVSIAAPACSVELQLLPRGSDFYDLDSSSSALTLHTDVMAPMMLVQRQPTLDDTAYVGADYSMHALD